MKRRQYLLLVALTVIAGLIGGAVSSWILMAKTAGVQETQKHEKVVTAEEFRVIDEEGKTRAMLAMLPDGSPNLVLFDNDLTPRVQIAVSAIGAPGILCFDKSGYKGAIASIGLLYGDTPSIGLIDSDGNNRIQLSIDPDDDVAILGLYDKHERPRAKLIGMDEATILVLFDKEGKVMWSAP